MTVPPPDPGALTPPDTPFGDVVGLASGSIDGVLSTEEQAAGQNPQVRALVDRFTSLRGSLGQPVEVDDSLREHHLATALAAFALGDTPDTATQTSGNAPVLDLERARQRRLRRIAPFAAAAAAVAVLGLVIGSVAGRRSSTDDLSLTAEKTVSTTLREAADSPPVPEVAEPAEAGAAVTDAERSVAIAATETAIASSASTDTTVSGTNGNDEQPTYVANDIAQLAPIAQSVLQAQRVGSRVLPPSTCPDVRGITIARMLWSSRPALLVIAPSLEDPAQVLVVNAASCAVEATAALRS